VTVLGAADLVVIAARTLGTGSDAALAAMDLPAAQAALAEADLPGHEPDATLPDRAAAAVAGVALVHALLRHRPFPRQNQQVAVAAGLQFLSLNGWRADLNPAEIAAVVVEALASGRLTAADAATWLSPRLSPAPRPLRVRRAPVRTSRSGARRPRLLPAVPPPVGRAAASALFAGMVGGVVVLAAACSHAAGPSPAQAHPVRHVQQVHSAGLRIRPASPLSGGG
jgi:prophage maintenance system killer protein